MLGGCRAFFEAVNVPSKILLGRYLSIGRKWCAHHGRADPLEIVRTSYLSVDWCLKVARG